MMWRLRTKDGFIPEAYQRAGVTVPPGHCPPQYMQVQYGRPLRVNFYTDASMATLFGSEAEAWKAFDQGGSGRREGYVVERREENGGWRAVEGGCAE